MRIGGVGIFVWNEHLHGWHIYRKSVSFIYDALPDDVAIDEEDEQ